MNDGIVLIVLLLVYFFPTIVAILRGAKKQAGIVIINLILGWTLLGWVIALVWAVSAETKHEYKQRIYGER
jgi:uncharacterized RDD family membrane protein YckC